MLTIVDISDDVWFEILRLLTPLDVLCAHQTCLFLHDITSVTKHHEMNNYWQDQCKKSWSQIEKSKYKTNNWFSLFESMIDLIAKTKFVFTILLDQYPLIVPVIRSTKNQIIWKQNTAIKDLDSILKAAYSFYLTMDIISQHEQSVLVGVGILYGILTSDNVELFKIYAWDKSDNDIHSSKNDVSLLRESMRYNSQKIIKYILTDKKFQNVDVTHYFKVKGPKRGQRRPYPQSKNTPLMMAVQGKQMNTLSLLLKHRKMTKECINATDIYDRTALYLAIRSHRRDGMNETINCVAQMIKLLINDERTNCNVQTRDGTTPLMAAVGMVGHSKFVEALLSNQNCNIDVNFKNQHKNTVLHYIAGGKMRPTSVRDQQIKSAKILIKRPDLDPNILNGDGKTALQIAKEMNYGEIVNLLTE